MAMRHPELYFSVRLLRWCRDRFCSGADAFASAGALDMPSVRELFDLARQCYAESNRALNPDVREAPRNKGDSHMEKADELRRSETFQGAPPRDKEIG